MNSGNTGYDFHPQVACQPEQRSMASRAAGVGISDYIGTVKNLIEICITKYMNLEETMESLWRDASISHSITSILWGRLEESNPEFFRGYSLRLELLQQIKTFNMLISRQVEVMSQDYGNGTMGHPQDWQVPIFDQNFPSSGHGQLTGFSDPVPHSAIALPKNSYPSYPSWADDGAFHMRNMGAPNHMMISAQNSNLVYGFSDGSRFMHQDYPANSGNANIPQLPMTHDSSILPPSRGQYGGFYTPLLIGHTSNNTYSPMNTEGGTPIISGSFLY